MNDRAEQLARALELAPHPEGGRFRRVFTSEASVVRHAGGVSRPALSCIYYLLRRGEVSRWHRVAADEIWHWYEGGALTLYQVDPEFRECTRRRLGPFGADAWPSVAVPAGWWQAACPERDYVLAGCTVAPGFDYADFELLSDVPQALAALRLLAPERLDLV